MLKLVVVWCLAGDDVEMSSEGHENRKGWQCFRACCDVLSEDLIDKYLHLVVSGFRKVRSFAAALIFLMRCSRNVR